MIGSKLRPLRGEKKHSQLFQNGRDGIFTFDLETSIFAEINRLALKTQIGKTEGFRRIRFKVFLNFISIGFLVFIYQISEKRRNTFSSDDIVLKNPQYASVELLASLVLIKNLEIPQVESKSLFKSSSEEILLERRTLVSRRETILEYCAGELQKPYMNDLIPDHLNLEPSLMFPSDFAKSMCKGLRNCRHEFIGIMDEIEF